MTGSNEVEQEEEAWEKRMAEEEEQRTVFREPEGVSVDGKKRGNHKHEHRGHGERIG